MFLDSNRVPLDLVRERKPPFSPDNVVAEFAALLKAFGVTSVRGDRYGGEWPRERFRTHGVDYIPATLAKNDLYRELLPILNGGRAELLDHPRLAAQLCSLERRTARGGHDSIDHPPGAHDDVANAVAGAVVTASRAAVQESHFARRLSSAGRATFPVRTHGGRANQRLFTIIVSQQRRERRDLLETLPRNASTVLLPDAFGTSESSARSQTRPDQRAPQSPRISLISVRAPPPASHT